MRLHFSSSLRWSAAMLAGVLAITAGCSRPPDKTAGSSGAGPAATPTAQTEKSATAAENPAGPAKSSETPPATAPNSDEMPVPTAPVRPNRSE
jgi:hypothetical protein